MENHIDKYEQLLNPNCDKNFATGMKQLLIECDNNLSLSLTSKPSLINLIETHLDTPFEQLLGEAFLDHQRPFANSFKLSDIGRLTINREKIESNDALSIQQSIQNWERQFYILRKNNLGKCKHAVYDRLKMTIGTLELLLIHFSESFLPKKVQLKVSKRKQDGKAPTAKFQKSRLQYCKLCWRKTMKYEAERDFSSEEITLSKVRLSDNYCNYHNPSIPESKTNYVRDLRYKESFQNELNVLKRKKNPRTKELLKSNFSPSSRWYQYNTEFRLFDEELRKLAYLLAHSRLDTPIRKKIINLKNKGKTTQEIADAIGISRQAALKNIKYIDQKQREILCNVYLNQQEIEDNYLIGTPEHSRMLINNIDYTIEKNKANLIQEIKLILSSRKELDN